VPIDPPWILTPSLPAPIERNRDRGELNPHNSASPLPTGRLLFTD